MRMHTIYLFLGKDLGAPGSRRDYPPSHLVHGFDQGYRQDEDPESKGSIPYSILASINRTYRSGGGERPVDGKITITFSRPY